MEIKIIKIEEIYEETEVYDIQLAKGNNFIAEGVLVHNCELCKSLDGKVIDSNSSEYSAYQPPIHPKCRCSWISVSSDASNIPEPDFEKPDDDWIKKYAPFWFVIPEEEKKKKKDEIIHIELPYIPEAPELVFNSNDILSIEEFIRETEFRKEENTYEPE